MANAPFGCVAGDGKPALFKKKGEILGVVVRRVGTHVERHEAKHLGKSVIANSKRSDAPRPLSRFFSALLEMPPFSFQHRADVDEYIFNLSEHHKSCLSTSCGAYYTIKVAFASTTDMTGISPVFGCLSKPCPGKHWLIRMIDAFWK